MKLADYCRLCLVKTNVNSDELFFPIDSSVESKFTEITNVRFVKASCQEDVSRFPSKVCISCVSKLEEHYNYR